jgi:hypothetical protein
VKHREIAYLCFSRSQSFLKHLYGEGSGHNVAAEVRQALASSDKVLFRMRKENLVLSYNNNTGGLRVLRRGKKKHSGISSLEAVGGRNLMDRKQAIHYERLFYRKEKSRYRDRVSSIHTARRSFIVPLSFVVTYNGMPCLICSWLQNSIRASAATA